MSFINPFLRELSPEKRPKAEPLTPSRMAALIGHLGHSVRTVVMGALLAGAATGCKPSTPDTKDTKTPPVAAQTATGDAGTHPKTEAGEPPKPTIKPEDRAETGELLPDYPVSKKVAVIINGDNREERHISNVELAIDVLRGKGFKEFYVASDQELKSPGIQFKQFHGSQTGVDQLFAALGQEGVLKKDALVFFYTTGHGMGLNGSGCLTLTDGCYEQGKMVENLQLVKKAGARGIFVMDQCHSGSFPHAIINSGIEGVAMSPGVEGKETACQFFVTPFFENLRASYDSNKDGISESSEWFQAAMAGYQIQTGFKGHGEYTQSRPELTLNNLEIVLKSKKTVVVDVNATWCGPCKLYSRVLNEANGMVGEQIKIVNLTMDTNEEADQLFKKLGVPPPPSIPTTLIRKKDGTFKAIVGGQSLDQLLKNLAEFGVKANTEKYLAILTETTKKPKETIQKFVEAGITDPLFIMAGDEVEPAVRKVAANDPNMILVHADKLKSLPYFQELLDESIPRANMFAKLEFSEAYKNRPYYQKTIDEAIAQVFQSDPLALLNFMGRFKGEPWAGPLIRKVALKNPVGAMQFPDLFKNEPWALSVILEAAKQDPNSALFQITKFEGQPYYAEAAEKILKSGAEMSPGKILYVADRFMNQPWAEKAIREAAEKDPGTFLDVFEKYQKQPWATEALMATMKQKPRVVFDHLQLLNDHPRYEEILEKSVLAMVASEDQNAYALISQAARFQNKPWAKEVFISIARKEPFLLLENLSAFQTQPWAKDALLTAAEKNPLAVLHQSHLFAHVPYAQEIIKAASRTAAADKNNSEQILHGTYDITFDEDVIAMAAKSNPLKFLANANRFKDHSDFEDLLESAVRALAKKEPWATLKYAEQFQDKGYFEEILEKSARAVAESENPGMALAGADRFKSKPYFAAVIEKAARRAATKEPQAVLIFSKHFMDQPWAKEVVSQAAGRDPATTLMMVRHLATQKWGQPLIETAAKKEPSVALENSDQIAAFPWGQGIIEKAAGQSPRKALEFARFFANYPWAQPILEVATNVSTLEFKYADQIMDSKGGREILLKAAENNPSDALAYAYLYTAEEYRYKYSAFIEKAIRTSVGPHNNPNLVFQNLALFIDQPWAKEVILDAAQKWPQEVMQRADVFMDQPWAKEVILQILKTHPGKVFAGLRHFSDQPWADDVIRQAAEKDPEAALQEAWNLKDRPYFPQLIQQLVKTAEDKNYNILNSMGAFADQPWAEGFIRRAAQRRPKEAIYAYGQYGHLPYAKEVFSQSVQAIVASGNLGEVIAYFQNIKGPEGNAWPWAQEMIDRINQEANRLKK